MMFNVEQPLEAPLFVAHDAVAIGISIARQYIIENFILIPSIRTDAVHRTILDHARTIVRVERAPATVSAGTRMSGNYSFCTSQGRRRATIKLAQP